MRYRILYFGHLNDLRYYTLFIFTTFITSMKHFVYRPIELYSYFISLFYALSNSIIFREISKTN